MNEIPIADPEMGEAEVSRVVDVLESGRLADGPEVRAFESAFADYCGAARGVATTNGTTALHTALRAVGVGPGDTVLTTPFSFVASANTVRLAGAEPTFADVDTATFNLDPASVEARLAEGGVDAVLAVHLYGLPAAMDELAALADEYGIPLVEDAAQAHGAEVGGRRVGALGDAAAFSFYPTKNMTTGEGGMVTTDDDDVADRAARFVNHGRAAAGYEHVDLGHNFRLTSMAAAIGRAQLERLPGYNAARRENARRLDEALDGSGVVTPTEPAGYRHVYHQYTIRVGNRDEVLEALAERDIGAAVYYPTCIHEQPSYDAYDVSAPAAEALADEVLSLPVHPNVTAEDVERIGRAVAEIDIDPVSDRPDAETGGVADAR